MMAGLSLVIMHMVRLALFALMLSLAAATSAAPNWSDESAGRIDAALTTWVQENDVVGLTVGVVAGGETVFARGYGTAELGKNQPITPRSVFHWASISKPFVAVAVMQLVEQDRLLLDDRLVDVLPYFKMADADYRKITLRQLLSHTAGMPDVDDYEWSKPQTDDEALKRWVLELQDAKLLFKPGEGREYSNIGFEVLGLVVQETAGVSFERYMAQEIFHPLGMQDSSFFAASIEPALRVKGHVGKIKRRVASDYPYNRRHAPSSTLNTNVIDVGKFAAALLKGGGSGDACILSDASIRDMWSPAWVSPDDPARMAGLGWNVGRPWGGILAATHGGHDDGFRSFLFIAPEEGVAAFMVANDDTIKTRDVMLALLQELFPEQAAAEKANVSKAQ